MRQSTMTKEPILNQFGWDDIKWTQSKRNTMNCLYGDKKYVGKLLFTDVLQSQMENYQTVDRWLTGVV